MNIMLKNADVFTNGGFDKQDLIISDGKIMAVGKSLFSENCEIIDCDGLTVFPGFVDVHVHLREPGFSYKETVKSGSEAAARGGYVGVCSMPNLSPVPDNVERLSQQLDIIKNDAVIAVYPYGSITKSEAGEELSDMEALAPLVAGFSDDGKGVQEPEMMRAAMLKAKAFGKKIVAHCEDNSLLFGGYIHDGEYAKKNGHKGICSESEWGPIKRDVELLKETGAAYHVCHISTKESVEIIRKAKADGIDITCETGPHYLVMNDSMLRDEGRFKMNPPIRGEEDRKALVEGIKDGTIDMIATDHAPHSKEEKGRGLKGSLMGIVGIETAFPILYTELVKKDVISLDRLIELLSINPRKRFNEICVGDNNESFSVWALDECYKIDPDDFISKGKSTPFEGKEVYGRCLMTLYKGKIVYFDKRFNL